MKKRELVALILLSYIVLRLLISDMWLFLKTPMDCYAVCDCDISWSYSLTFFNL